MQVISKGKCQETNLRHVYLDFMDWNLVTWPHLDEKEVRTPLLIYTQLKILQLGEEGSPTPGRRVNLGNSGRSGKGSQDGSRFGLPSEGL